MRRVRSANVSITHLIRVRGLPPPGASRRSARTSLRAPSRPVPPRRAEPPRQTCLRPSPYRQSPSHPVTQSPSHPVTQSPSPDPVTQSPSHPVTQSSPVTQSPVSIHQSPRRGVAPSPVTRHPIASRQSPVASRQSPGRQSPGHQSPVASHQSPVTSRPVAPSRRRPVAPSPCHPSACRLPVVDLCRMAGRPHSVKTKRDLRAFRHHRAVGGGSARRGGTGREGARSEVRAERRLAPGGGSPLTRMRCVIETFALLTRRTFIRSTNRMAPHVLYSQTIGMI